MGCPLKFVIKQMESTIIPEKNNLCGLKKFWKFFCLIWWKILISLRFSFINAVSGIISVDKFWKFFQDVKFIFMNYMEYFQLKKHLFERAPEPECRFFTVISLFYRLYGTRAILPQNGSKLAKFVSFVGWFWHNMGNLEMEWIFKWVYREIYLRYNDHPPMKIFVLVWTIRGQWL